MAQPSESLFIGDLPASIDDGTLQSVLGAYGGIKSLKVLPVSSRGSGAAIVTFNNATDATWIVQNLNGNIPQGLTTPIKASYKQNNLGGGGGAPGIHAPAAAPAWNPGGVGVTIGGLVTTPQYGAPMAQPQYGGGGGYDKGGGKGGGPASPSENVFIGDLPAAITEQELVAVFGAYGTVKSHKMLAPGRSGSMAAIVTWDSIDKAKWVVENLNGNIPQGLTSPIVCRYKASKNPSAAAQAYGAPPPPAYGAYGAAPAPMMAVGGVGGGILSLPDAVLVGDLPQGIDDATLQSVFGAYGMISSHQFLPPTVAGAQAVISFSTKEEATWCVEHLNGNIPQGLQTPIRCVFKNAPGIAVGGGKGMTPY